MNKELWSNCQSGTLDEIGKAQQRRNMHRRWSARLMSALVILVVPSILLIGLLKPPSISCQQAVTWFEAARTDKLSTVENRSFQLHLLFCGKCRNSFAEIRDEPTTTVSLLPASRLACCTAITGPQMLADDSSFKRVPNFD